MKRTSYPNDRVPRKAPGVVRAKLFAGLFASLAADAAWAHVKWFVDYNLEDRPRNVLGVVTSHYFVSFCIATGALMFAVALADRYLTGRQCFLHRHATALTEQTSPWFPLVLRIGVSAFFTAVFVYGCLGQSMILTPELHTHRNWICWVQLALAIIVLLPSTTFVAGAGIVFLYGCGIAEYGVFHMLDYPIFLGVAVYLILESLYGERRRRLAGSVLRISAGVTLLWASIEKFAFPEWSFLLMQDHPGMTLGFNPEFYMVAAGFVEFCAAYLLITGSLSARIAAFGLLVMFVAAIVPFGSVDAVGHSVIIVVLLMLTLSDNHVSQRLGGRTTVTTAAIHASAFFATLALFVVLYYAGYMLSYGPGAH